VQSAHALNCMARCALYILPALLFNNFPPTVYWFASYLGDDPCYGGAQCCL